jgi:glycosyltransferase involved in cell wall biosynthesis
MNPADAPPVADVTIVIRTLNEGLALRRCLESLSGQATPRRIEVVVVDSGSTDTTLEVAHAAGASVVPLAGEAFNYGRALNLGISAASAPLVVAFTAHAAAADERWLERLLEPVDRDTRVAGTFSRELPWPTAHPVEAARLAVRFPAVSRRWELRLDPGAVRTVQYSNVAAAARTSLLRACPFPELAYGEDRVWAAAVVGEGMAIEYVAEARVYHSHAEGLAAFYARQKKIGRARVEAGGRASVVAVSRTAAADLWRQAAVLRRTLSLGGQARWIPAAGLWALARVYGQWRGGRGR